MELGVSLSSVIVCHGKWLGRRILPVFFSLLMFSFGCLVYLYVRSVTRLSIKNCSWCDIVPGVAAVHARAEICSGIAVFLTKNTHCVCQKHTNCVVGIACNLLWQITVTILLVAVGVWIVLFGLLRTVSLSLSLSHTHTTGSVYLKRSGADDELVKMDACVQVW